MNTVLKHEVKINIKLFMIWFVCVAGMGFACILMFSGMEEDMEGMAEGFASMGAFADAFGMSTLSIGTLVGFYATEIGVIHSLGGSMFGAILSTTMLSKEEDGHTGEFLLTLPVSRTKVVMAKWIGVVALIALFNLCCTGVYVLGFFAVGEEIPTREFVLFHGMQFMLHIEIAAICYVVSAFSKKNKLGVGMGIVLLAYAFDLMARVIPDLKDFIAVSPFSYANASDIFSKADFRYEAVVLGIGVILGSLAAAFVHYNRKDMAS